MEDGVMEMPMRTDAELREVARDVDARARALTFLVLMWLFTEDPRWPPEKTA